MKPDRHKTGTPASGFASPPVRTYTITRIVLMRKMQQQRTQPMRSLGMGWAPSVVPAKNDEILKNAGIQLLPNTTSISRASSSAGAQAM